MRGGREGPAVVNAPHSDRGPMLSMAAMGTTTGVLAVLWFGGGRGCPGRGAVPPG